MKKAEFKDILKRPIYAQLKHKQIKKTTRLITKVSPADVFSHNFFEIPKESFSSVDSDENQPPRNSQKIKILRSLNSSEAQAVIEPPKITMASTNTSFNRSFSSLNLNDSKEHEKYKTLESKYKNLQTKNIQDRIKYESEIENLKLELCEYKEKTPCFQNSQNQVDSNELLQRILEELGNLKVKMQNLEKLVIK